MQTRHCIAKSKRIGREFCKLKRIFQMEFDIGWFDDRVRCTSMWQNSIDPVIFKKLWHPPIMINNAGKQYKMPIGLQKVVCNLSAL